MHKLFLGLFSLVLIAALTGCSSEEAGQSTNATPIPSSDERHAEEDSQSTDMPAEGSAAVEQPAEAAAPAEAAITVEAAAPAADDLTGSKWTYKEIELEFKEGNKVFLKGGPVAALAPEGHETTYTLNDGKIEVDVFGQVYSGTWDGAALAIDGTEAVKMQ